MREIIELTRGRKLHFIAPGEVACAYVRAAADGVETLTPKLLRGAPGATVSVGPACTLIVGTAAEIDAEIARLGLNAPQVAPAPAMTAEQALAILAETYKDEPFIRVSKDLPSTKNVALTNFCDLSARIASGRLVVLSAIDNLIKGASGQAIQNMNLQFGLPETAGLLC
jgi:hypothetical protein